VRYLLLASLLPGHITSGDLALDLAVGLICGLLAYRISERHRLLRGVTPWHVPSVAWGVLCFLVAPVGVLLQMVAQLTTRPAMPRELGAELQEPPTNFLQAGAGQPLPPESPGLAQPVAGRAVADGGGSNGTRQSGARSWNPLARPGQSSATPGRAATPGSVDPMAAWAPVPSLPPFGWYEDPAGRHEQRYWDGRLWSEHVKDDGVRSIDPL